MAARECSDGCRHQRAPAAQDDLLQVAHKCLTQRDGAVQIANALVDDAHRVTAVPWAMGAKTTGAEAPLGARPHIRPCRTAVPLHHGRRAQAQLSIR